MNKGLTFLILFISSILAGQNFDSLLRESSKLKTDTDKVNFFYREGFDNRYLSPGYAYQCAKKSLSFAENSKSDYHKAKAYNLLGILYYRKGDLNQALQYHQKAYELREMIHDEYGMALSETNLGNILSDLKEYDMAEKSYLNALSIYQRYANDKQTGNSYVNLGVLMENQGKLIEAEKYFYNAYKISKDLIDYELEAMCLNNLSVINYENGDYDASIGNALNAIKIKDIMGNEMEKADSYINLAKAYYKLKDTSSGAWFLNKADSLCTVYEYTDAKILLLAVKEKVLEESGDYKGALLAYKSFVHLSDSIKKVNESVKKNYRFSESDYETKQKIKEHQHPYRIIALLLIIFILSTYYLFKHKR